MTNRREILQGGIALTSLPLVARAPWSSPDASAHSWYTPYRVIFDDRFPETRVFGEEAERLGGSVRSFGGDITDLWYQELDLRWRSEPAAIAGMTRHGPLFCLERLAWNAGMRVVYRATHAVRDNATTHFLSGSRMILSVASDLLARETDWARCAARIVMRCPMDPTARATTLALSGTGEKPTDNEDPLISWVIAPRTRGQGA